jgi:hypothetical protein
VAVVAVHITALIPAIVLVLLAVLVAAAVGLLRLGVQGLLDRVTLVALQLIHQVIHMVLLAAVALVLWGVAAVVVLVVMGAMDYCLLLRVRRCTGVAAAAAGHKAVLLSRVMEGMVAVAVAHVGHPVQQVLVALDLMLVVMGRPLVFHLVLVVTEVQIQVAVAVVWVYL